MNHPLSGCGVLFLCVSLFVSCSYDFRTADSESRNTETPPYGTLIPIDDIYEIPPAPSLDPYGFREDDYEVEEGQIRRNESLYVILRRYDVSPLQIQRLQESAADHANLRRMRPGQDYRIYLRDDRAVAMVWNIDRRHHLILDWSREDEILAQRDQFELRRVPATVSGTIESSLYLALQRDNVNPMVGSQLAEIYGWEIDFFSLRSGDSYKAIYDELYIGDEFYGIGEIHSAVFTHRGNRYNAYYFESDTQEGYFDEEGNSLERDLLKAPFTYNQRVSSGFSHNRMHPILGERRPHYGVDYAASTGTPIIAVGDGRVTEARRRGGNGNIVQIRHNSTYRTAYLHLSRFASGIRPGAEVEQGQVIGYVGQTGLATGPHLCYRLYVNDQPVNSLTADLPVSESLDEDYLDEFQRVIERYDYELAMIAQPDLEETFSNVLFDAERTR